jgi:hypothetical protein
MKSSSFFPLIALLAGHVAAAYYPPVNAAPVNSYQPTGNPPEEPIYQPVKPTYVAPPPPPPPPVDPCKHCQYSKGAKYCKKDHYGKNIGCFDKLETGYTCTDAWQCKSNFCSYPRYRKGGKSKGHKTKTCQNPVYY